MFTEFSYVLDTAFICHHIINYWLNKKPMLPKEKDMQTGLVSRLSNDYKDMKRRGKQ